MQNVMNQVVMMVEHLRKRITDLEFITSTYHEWKKDREEFTKYLLKKVEKLREDRADDSVSDDRRQKVSKSEKSNNS